MEADLSSSPGQSYRQLSLWWDGQPHPIEVRPPLGGDIDVDVAVVGGGLTGLWTAFYLVDADPTLRIAVLERDVAGFGASGRNGGWCSALFAVSERAPGRRGRACRGHGHAPSHGGDRRRGRPHRRVRTDRVRLCQGGHGDAGPDRSPTPARPRRGDSRTRPGHRRGGPPVPVGRRRLDHGGATDVLGGTYTPHCAAVDPASLVRGLARAVERRGVTIYERTEVRAIAPGWRTQPGGG